MKRTYKRILVMTAAALMAVSALAEGPLLAVYNAGSALLLKTDNVTLTGKATFTYDGQCFKTLQGRYIQDGDKSVMDVELTTPLDLGGSRTGGYRVIADGDRVFGSDPEAFGPQRKPAATQVLSNKIMSQLVSDLGGMAVRLAEGKLGEHITVSQMGKSTAYRLELTADQTPALFDKGLSLVAQTMIDEYFYSYERMLPVVTVDKRSALIALFYEEMYGKKPTDKVLNATIEKNPTDYLRYQNARQAMLDYLKEIEQTTPYSAVAVCAADKSQTNYDAYNDFLLARGQQILQFEDYSPTLSLYAQEHPQSADPAQDMRAYYQQVLAENNCAGMLIEGDGDYILCYNDEELSHLAPYRQSVTQRICTQLKDITLQNADVTAVLDAQGRMTAFYGQMSLNVVDFINREHVLTIDFNCTAEAYGQSKIDISDYYNNTNDGTNG